MHSLQPQQNAQLRPRGHDENILEEAYRCRYARQRLLNFWPESSCGYHAIKRFVCIIQVAVMGEKYRLSAWPRPSLQKNVWLFSFFRNSRYFRHAYNRARDVKCQSARSGGSPDTVNACWLGTHCRRDIAR